MDLEDVPVDANARSVVQNMIGKDWKKFGRELGIQESILEGIILYSSGYDVTEMVAQVFKVWQQKKPDAYHLRSLIQCLKNIDRNDIVEIILNNQHYKESVIKDTGEYFMKETQQKLKAIYSTLQMRGLPWMENIKLTLEEYYVELSLNLYNTKLQSIPIKLEQIFTAMKNKENAKPSRILLEGAMGYGKTSLSSKLCFDWARNDIYPRHFDIVIFLPLRNVDGELDEMLFRASRVSNEKRNEFKRLINDNSKQVLIILDGLDELSPFQKQHILPLLQRNKLNHATVVATSKPGKFSYDSTSEKDPMTWFRHNTGVDIDYVTSVWDRQLSIIGISEKTQLEFTNKYLTNYSPAQREMALRQLKHTSSNNLLPSEFLKSPLFLMMIILVLTEKNRIHTLKTKTDLYKCLFNFVLHRYLVVKKNYDSLQKIDMFDPEVNSSYVTSMVQFGQICLNALQSDQVFFHADDLIDRDGICEVAEVGFLTKNVLHDGLETKVTYEPIHKSMIEFAAAYRLWLSFTKEPRDCWEKHVPLLVKLRPQYNSSASSFLFIFLAGLLGKEACGLFDVLRPFASEYNEWFGSLCYSLIEIEVMASTKNKHYLSGSLFNLLPSTWLIPWKNDDRGFATTAQHETIIQLGIDTCKINAVKWNVHEEARFPKDLKIGILVVEFTEPTVQVFPIDKIILSCEELFVSVQTAIINVQGFQNVVQAIDFQTMSVCLRNDASVVRLCYKDVETAKADVKHNMIYLCGFHITYMQIFLMAGLTNLVKQNALDMLDMKLKPQETEVYFSYFSFLFLCSFLSTFFSSYLQDLFTHSLSIIWFIFIFSVLSSHIDVYLDFVVNRVFSWLVRRRTPSFYVQLTQIVCKYIPFSLLTFRFLAIRFVTFMLLLLNTYFLKFSSLYKFVFCISVVCLMPQTSHINMIVKSLLFTLLKNNFFEFFSELTIINGCLLVYSMFCVDFSYHLYRQLKDVWGAYVSLVYFFLFFSVPFLVPSPLNVILVSVVYIGLTVVVVMYPTSLLLQHFYINYLSINSSCNRIDNLSPTPNDRIHNFFKNFLFCSCFCLVFHCVLYILFSASSVGYMRDYICPLLPLLPLHIPSFVFSWLCRLLKCDKVTEKHFDELIRCAGTSTNLTQFILGNQCDLGWFPRLVFLFGVDLSDLTNQGLKSWNWVQIEDVEIKCRRNIRKEFEIQHFDFSNSDLSYSDIHDNYLRNCQVNSLVCRSSFLNAISDFWSVQKQSLKELYVKLDETFSASTEMNNLKVFAVMITALENISFSLSNILYEGKLNSLEIWNVENNSLLAQNLVEDIVKLLEINMDDVSQDHSELSLPFISIKRLRINQVTLLTDIMPDLRLNHSSSPGEKKVLNLLKLTSMLKKLLLEKSLLQLDIVCHREVVHYMSVHESEEIAGSWVEAFPPHQGFQVKHDLWGTADEDSIRSKGVARRYPDKYHRFSIRISEMPLDLVSMNT